MKKIYQNELIEDIFEKIKIKKYILTYIFELKRHFNITNEQMQEILFEIYQDSKPINPVKIFIKKLLDMLKSKCNKIKLLRKK